MPEIVEGEVLDTGPLTGGAKPFLHIPIPSPLAVCEYMRTVKPPD
jgi:hypothetical protein